MFLIGKSLGIGLGSRVFAGIFGTETETEIFQKSRARPVPKIYETFYEKTQIILTKLTNLIHFDSNELITDSLLFLLSKLSEQKDSTIAQKLFKSITERIQQRRHKKLISALLFLHSGKFPQNNQHLSYDSKFVIKKTVKDLSLRLFTKTAAHNVDTEEIVEDETDQDEMEKSIQSLLAQPQSSSSIEK